MLQNAVFLAVVNILDSFMTVVFSMFEEIRCVCVWIQVYDMTCDWYNRLLWSKCTTTASGISGIIMAEERGTNCFYIVPVF